MSVTTLEPRGMSGLKARVRPTSEYAETSSVMRQASRVVTSVNRPSSASRGAKPMEWTRTSTRSQIFRMSSTVRSMSSSLPTSQSRIAFAPRLSARGRTRFPIASPG